MRVFQINTVYDTGSTGRIVAQLKRAVEMEGGACEAAYGRGQTDAADTYRIGTDKDMYMHALLTRITDKTAFYSTKHTKKLMNEIERFHPDIIHLHNLHGYYINAEVLFDFLKKYNRPVVWTFHDCWPFTGHCAYYTAAKCNKWQEHCKECPQKNDYPASKLLDGSSQNFDRKKAAFLGVDNMTIVTPSKWLAEEVKSSFLKDYQVKVIPNGIDIGAFKPTTGSIREKFGISDKKIVLGVANIWSERKGLKDFLKVADQLDDSYVMVLVGLSEQQLKQVPNGVVGIKRTESVRELAELYSEALVFLNLTYEDNFPTVNLESLACGTPVITYMTGGSPEALDELTGVCVEPGNIDGVIAGIKTINKLSRDECRKRAEQYDKEARFQEYIELYQKILNG